MTQHFKPRKARRPSSKLTDIQQSLSSILGNERLQQVVGLTRLRRLWPHIVGAMMAQRSEPVELKMDQNGSMTLIIAVNHSTIAQQIIFLRDAIRSACFEQAKLGRIAKIFTRVQVISAPNNAQNSAVPKPVALNIKKQLASELKNIKNRTLRHAMFDARLAQLRYSLGDHP
ncbi:MAG: DUF721 domain-containing protein [Mariprofundaceae bacterium]